MLNKTNFMARFVLKKSKLAKKSTNFSHFFIQKRCDHDGRRRRRCPFFEDLRRLIHTSLSLRVVHFGFASFLYSEYELSVDEGRKLRHFNFQGTAGFKDT